MDLDEKFRVMIASKCFSSFNELNYQIKHFEEETGSVFRFRMSHRYPKDDPDSKRIVYKRCSYVCIHYGNYESRAVHQSKRKTLRSGCAAYFEMKGSSEGVRVARYSMVHNHVITMGTTHLQVIRRRLTPGEKMIIKDMIRAKADNKFIRSFIREKFHKIYDAVAISQLRYRLTRIINDVREEKQDILLPYKVISKERNSLSTQQPFEESVDLDAPKDIAVPTSRPQIISLTDLSHIGFEDKVQSAYLSVSQRMRSIFQRVHPCVFPELMNSCDAWLSTIEKQVDDVQPKIENNTYPFCKIPRQSSHPIPSSMYESDTDGFRALAGEAHQLSLTFSETIEQIWKLSSETDVSDDGHEQDGDSMEICLECEQHYPRSVSSSSISSSRWIVCQGCRGWFHQICVRVRNPVVFFCRKCIN